MRTEKRENESSFTRKLSKEEKEKRKEDEKWPFIVPAHSCWALSLSENQQSEVDERKSMGRPFLTVLYSTFISYR